MKIILYFLLSYISLLGISYYLQDKLIFFPEKLNTNYNFQLPAFGKELFLKTLDGVHLNAILYEQPPNKTIIIYFHGNAGSLATWKEVAKEFLSFGCNVLIIDYRGYGKSTGNFSEKGFYIDAQTAYQYARKLGYKDSQIIFYGRSLGTGVAIEMAVQHPVKGLILETPYTRLSTLAMKHYWYLLPNFLLRYQFDNINKVSKLQMPVLILHGTNDELIPVTHSEILSKAISIPHTLILISNGQHNNLNTFPLYQHSIEDYLNHLQ